MDALDDAPAKSEKGAKWAPPEEIDLDRCAREAWELWKLDQPTTISIDTETTGLGWDDTPFGVSVAWRSESVGGPDRTDVCGGWFDLERVPQSSSFVRRIVEHARVIVGHNIRFDQHKLARVGIDFSADLHDTQIMAHLLDEHRPTGLKALAVSVLGAEAVDGTATEKAEVDAARRWAKKEYGLPSVKDVGYHLLPRATVVPYAIKDAEWTFQLAATFMPTLATIPDLYGLYQREMALSSVLYDLERAGMGVDTDYVSDQIRAYAVRMEEHLQKIADIVGKPCRIGHIPPKERDSYFNPASNKEVGEWFAAHGYEADSYDAQFLAVLTGDRIAPPQHAKPNALASALLSMRADKKILETYLIALKRETAADGLFHPSIRQTGTVTGRTSSGAALAD